MYLRVVDDQSCRLVKRGWEAILGPIAGSVQIMGEIVRILARGLELGETATGQHHVRDVGVVSMLATQ